MLLTPQVITYFNLEVKIHEDDSRGKINKLVREQGTKQLKYNIKQWEQLHPRKI